MNKIKKLFQRKIKTYSADSIGELEHIWKNHLMDNGWDIEEPIDVRFNWLRFTPEFYFKVKRIS